MLPIFLFPIAVLNSIHISSDIFEKHSGSQSIRETIILAINDLFSPMLFTSLTSGAGFFSLMFTPILPVQVFGFFVGFGIFTAWLLSMTLLPAYTVLLPKKTFHNFGTAGKHRKTVIDKVLKKIQNMSLKYVKLII